MLNFARDRLFQLTSGILGIVTTAAMVASCAKGLPKASNVPASGEEAQSALDGRLRKTEEIRVRIQRVSDALRPVEDVLRDISDAVDVRIDGERGIRVRTFLQKLQDLLREATRGVLDHRPDGSWVLERPIHCGEERGLLRLESRRAEGHESAVLSAMGCGVTSRTGALTEVAEVSYDSESDRIELRLHASRLETALNLETRDGTCRLEIAGKNSQLHCDPFTAGSVRFSRLEAVETDGRLEAHVFAWLQYRLQGEESQRFASLTFDRAEGGRPTLDIRTCLDAIE